MKSLAVFILGLCFTIAGFAQTDSLPAYKRFPAFPPVTLLLADSASHFTKDQLPKKTPVILMVFNPACEHCQHETEELIANMDKFKNFKIIMATTSSISEMKNFINHYFLYQYKNIVIGQDTHYFLPVFYMMRNLPYLAFYGKDGQLLDTMEGTRHIADIMKVFE